MRNVACDQWILCRDQEEFIFLTGDLGFMALERLRDSIKDRFINVGVAEQNMVSVAAGMALEGRNVWLYSIAPFCYARPFEQIRNDICHHNLPVKLVGNGGGYSYGPMGMSHHALEDYGTLLTLPNMKTYIPAFGNDLNTLIPLLNKVDHPAYLRLGRCEQPRNLHLPPYFAWRKLLTGAAIPILIVGPLAGLFWSHCVKLPDDKRPELWVLSELPKLNIEEIPSDFLSHVKDRGLCVVEEHVAQGSAGQQICTTLMLQNIYPNQYFHFFAQGYPSTTYGSHSFHRRESGIEPDQVLKRLNIQ